MMTIVEMQQHKQQLHGEECQQKQQLLQHQLSRHRRRRTMSNNQEKYQSRYTFYCCVLLSTIIGLSTHLCLAFNYNNNLNQKIWFQKQTRNLIISRMKQEQQRQQQSCTNVQKCHSLLVLSSSSSVVNDDEYLEISKLVPTTSTSTSTSVAPTAMITQSRPITSSIATSSESNIEMTKKNVNNKQQSLNNNTWQTLLNPIAGLLLYCISMTIILISFEDILCQWVLPSRHRTELLSIVQQQQQSSSLSSLSESWGQSTIGGLGFGEKERMLLYDTSSSLANDDYTTGESTSTSVNTFTSTGTSTTEHLVGYNEIMLQHRTITVPQWKETKRIITTSTRTTAKNSNSNSNSKDQQQQSVDEQKKILVANAIKVIIDNYKQLKELEQYANDYQWDTIRSIIHTSKSIINLSQAGTVLRTYIQYQLHNTYTSETTFSKDTTIIGMDWGSCAWKNQCGSIADIQESYDEIDTLLGILQPYEIFFCYDIIERSIRDMLVIVPWNLAYPQDYDYYLSIPSYISKVSTSASTPTNENDNDNDYDDLSKFDQEYIRALQQLRVE